MGGRAVMEDAGRIRFTCTWEGQRKTGRDVMGLKEWEQESQGERESVGLEREAFPSGCCSTSHYVRL